MLDKLIVLDFIWFQVSPHWAEILQATKEGFVPDYKLSQPTLSSRDTGFSTEILILILVFRCLFHLISLQHVHKHRIYKMFHSGSHIKQNHGVFPRYLDLAILSLIQKEQVLFPGA